MSTSVINLAQPIFDILDDFILHRRPIAPRLRAHKTVSTLAVALPLRGKRGVAWLVLARGAAVSVLARVVDVAIRGLTALGGVVLAREAAVEVMALGAVVLVDLSALGAGVMPWLWGPWLDGLFKLECTRLRLG